MSRILITGAAGFLAQRLIKRIVSTDPEERVYTDCTHLIAWDHTSFELPEPEHLTVDRVVGDLMDDKLLCDVMADDIDMIVHLAAVVSAQAEEDFDLGLRVNFDATRALLEAARRFEHAPIFLMTSSVAVFGGDLPPQVPDSWMPVPKSSYGTEKAMCELLVSDYSRRGWIDGRVLRVPTVSVRPGRPNKAASSFASSIIREPLNNERAICPVDPETRMWLMSPDRAVDALVHGCMLHKDKIGGQPVISLPGLSVPVREMAASLARVAGQEVADRIEWLYDPAIAAIVQSWPGDFEAERAVDLGFQADQDMDSIVAAHMADMKAETSEGTND